MRVNSEAFPGVVAIISAPAPTRGLPVADQRLQDAAGRATLLPSRSFGRRPSSTAHAAVGADRKLI